MRIDRHANSIHLLLAMISIYYFTGTIAELREQIIPAYERKEPYPLNEESK